MKYEIRVIVEARSAAEAAGYVIHSPGDHLAPYESVTVVPATWLND